MGVIVCGLVMLRNKMVMCSSHVAITSPVCRMGCMDSRLNALQYSLRRERKLAGERDTAHGDRKCSAGYELIYQVWLSVH